MPDLGRIEVQPCMKSNVSLHGIQDRNIVLRNRIWFWKKVRPIRCIIFNHETTSRAHPQLLEVREGRVDMGGDVQVKRRIIVTNTKELLYRLENALFHSPTSFPVVL